MFFDNIEQHDTVKNNVKNNNQQLDCNNMSDKVGSNIPWSKSADESSDRLPVNNIDIPDTQMVEEKGNNVFIET